MAIQYYALVLNTRTVDNPFRVFREIRDPASIAWRPTMRSRASGLRTLTLPPTPVWRDRRRAHLEGQGRRDHRTWLRRRLAALASQRLGPLVQDIEIPAVSKQAPTLFAGDLADDFKLLHVVDCPGHSWKRYPDLFGRACDRENGMGLSVLMYPKD